MVNWPRSWHCEAAAELWGAEFERRSGDDRRYRGAHHQRGCDDDDVRGPNAPTITRGAWVATVSVFNDPRGPTSCGPFRRSEEKTARGRAANYAFRERWLSPRNEMHVVDAPLSK